MRRALAALLTGEALLLAGLWFAWWPLAPITAGLQLVALGLTFEPGSREVTR